MRYAIEMRLEVASTYLEQRSADGWTLVSVAHDGEAYALFWRRREHSTVLWLLTAAGGLLVVGIGYRLTHP